MQKSIFYISESLKSYYPETEISAFSRLIICFATGISFSDFLANRDKALTEEEEQKIVCIVDRLKTYEPIQYILGETEFYGLPFFVNRDTLIPRPETEELVELIINENKEREVSILDIGTGSGCIAVTLAKYLEKASVSAWDFSQGALDVAKQNAENNNVDVNFAKVDVLTDFPSSAKYDVIVSNPPYVLESEKKDMLANVLDYEPHSALFVPDNRALLFYDRIADIALNILNTGGLLYFEINQAKGKETIEMLEEKGFADIMLLQDISKRDRMVRATLK